MKKIQTNISIGKVIQNGIIFDVKNWGKMTMTSDNLLQVVERLFFTLEQRQVNYLLVGGIALLSYVEGRNTQYIDFILSRNVLETLPEIIIEEENKDFIRGSFEELQIDILLTQNQLFDLVLKDFATWREFGEKTVRCVTVEGLILLKLYALPSLYRQGNFTRAGIYENDILLLLLNYPIKLDQLFNILQQHLVSTDLESLREIIQEIESKINRFSR